MCLGELLNIFNTFIVRTDCADIYGGILFLTEGGGLRILELVCCNDIKYHWVYRELLTSLRL